MRIPLRLAAFVLTASLLISCDQAVNAQTATDTTSGVDNQDPHVDLKTITPSSEVIIPGPLRSFLRMAGISQKASPEDVLPLLARNVYVQGYQGWEERGRPTEFLLLLQKYLKQAKELAAFAGSEGTIHVSTCEQAAPLLQILGYRMRAACGQG